jgi:hypothetical protein
VPLALTLAAATPVRGGGSDGLPALLSVRLRDVDGTPAATGIRAARASRPVLALAEPRVPSLAGPEPGGRPDPRELQPAPLAVSSRLDPSRGPPPA